jgi:hypothetical protein
LVGKHHGEKGCATQPFRCDGQEQFVTVGYPGQSVHRRDWSSKLVVDEAFCPITRSGCAIEEIGASPSGEWLVTQRFSGQGEWGYDVFRTCPLAREAGIAEEYGYMLDLPRFAADESFLIGGAGPGFLGGWWAHPDDDIETPSRGGLVSLGFLFVHRLPTHRVSRLELVVELPPGWVPTDPGAEWYGPREIAPIDGGVRLMPSWGVPVELPAPLPSVIRLPAPHPSGVGLL